MNLISPINNQGLGVVGLNVALGLERAGREPALWPIGKAEASPENRPALSRMIARRHFYDPRKPSLRIWHLNELAQHVGKARHCAFAFFELDRLKPAERHNLAAQDLVFAPSRWAKEVLLANGIPEASIRIARPGVDTRLFAFDESRPPARSPSAPTVFINVGKWEVRKGHDILPEAFSRAFSLSDNVRLIMCCYNPCLPPDAAEDYHQRFVTLYERRLGTQAEIVARRLQWQAEVAALMRSADCGVFPSRGEGWNLGALEMMALGKPVILTNYSAHTEYATPENARLIDIDRTEPAVDGVWFRSDRETWGNGEPGRWAVIGEPEIEQLVEHLRAVHRAKQEGRLEINRAGLETAQRLSWDNTVAELLTGLEA